MEGIKNCLLDENKEVIRDISELKKKNYFHKSAPSCSDVVNEFKKLEVV